MCDPEEATVQNVAEDRTAASLQAIRSRLEPVTQVARMLHRHLDGCCGGGLDPNPS